MPPLRVAVMNPLYLPSVHCPPLRKLSTRYGLRNIEARCFTLEVLSLHTPSCCDPFTVSGMVGTVDGVLPSCTGAIDDAETASV
jgi:hypothetical protein